MKRLLRPDLLLPGIYIGGLAAIAVGVGMASTPAGFVVGGALAAGSAWVYEQHGGGDGE